MEITFEVARLRGKPLTETPIRGTDPVPDPRGTDPVPSRNADVLVGISNSQR
jgi:hypothetical protein